jgi:hypothetical protein
MQKVLLYLKPMTPGKEERHPLEMAQMHTFRFEAKQHSLGVRGSKEPRVKTLLDLVSQAIEEMNSKQHRVSELSRCHASEELD